jgi:cullin-5
VEATEAFYKVKAPEYLQTNGVRNYMKYADAKLTEEEQRAEKYLEPHSGSVEYVSTLQNSHDD